MKPICLIMILLISFTNLNAAVLISNTSQTDTSINQTFSLPGNNIESILGRKLKLKEKIALSIYQKQLKNADVAKGDIEKKASANAILAFVLSILGITTCFLFPVLFLVEIPALIIGNGVLRTAKKNPDLVSKSTKSLAKAASIISLVSLILGLALTILLLIALSNLTFNFSNWNFM
jgi:hypothetical protein